jgi:mannose-6-phosphate isomerase-like protein (cupin superfamily)
MIILSLVIIPKGEDVPHITKEAAPSFTIPGLTVTGLAAPSRGATETSVWTIEIAPGTPGTPHAVDREEVFVALAGRAAVAVSGRELELEPGEALIVPAGETFAIGNPHGEPFRAVAAAPVGCRAVLPGGEPFVPPWAQ